MELKNKGQLIIAGLDIGNIKDIPQRTLEALNSSDFIVAEHAAIMMNNLDRIGIKYNGKMYNFYNDTGMVILIYHNAQQ